MDIKIESIKIKLDEKDLELTPQEAKELRDKLNEMFGSAPIQIPVWIENPYTPASPFYYTWIGTGSAIKT